MFLIRFKSVPVEIYKFSELEHTKAQGWVAATVADSNTGKNKPGARQALPSQLQLQARLHELN